MRGRPGSLFDAGCRVGKLLSGASEDEAGWPADSFPASAAASEDAGSEAAEHCAWARDNYCSNRPGRHPHAAKRPAPDIPD